MNVNYDDDYIRAKYKAAIDRTEINETGKNKVRSLAYNKEMLNGKGNVIKVTRRITKTAAVLITVFCMIAVGGGIAWAMTSSALKDYFFPKNDRTFETVYAEANKKYDFDDYIVTYSGSVYDAAVGRGYLQFNFADGSGNPINVADALEYNEKLGFGRDNTALTRRVSVHGYTLGDTNIIFLFMNNDSLYTIKEGSNVLVKFSTSRNEVKDSKPVSFMVLNESEWKEIAEKVEELDESALCASSYDYNTLTPILYYDRDSMQPEVAEILMEYDPIEIKNTTSPPQIVEEKGLKITVGRLDVLFEYNADSCNAHRFILKRKDGTEIIFNRNDDESWSVVGLDKDRVFVSCKKSGRKIEKDYTMGVVLDPDEKVMIEIE